jgi:hypothetical protein
MPSFLEKLEGMQQQLELSIDSLIYMRPRFKNSIELDNMTVQ